MIICRKINICTPPLGTVVESFMLPQIVIDRYIHHCARFVASNIIIARDLKGKNVGAVDHICFTFFGNNFKKLFLALSEGYN